MDPLTNIKIKPAAAGGPNEVFIVDMTTYDNWNFIKGCWENWDKVDGKEVITNYAPNYETALEEYLSYEIKDEKPNA